MAAVPPDRRLYVDVFCLSLAAIVLEIAFTRIFSFKLFYYFTYLIIGIALLGLGAGGVAVALSRRLRAMAPAALVPGCALAAGTGVLVGYLVIAAIPLDAIDLIIGLSRGEVAEVWPDLAAFVVVVGLLQLPFLAVGVALASIFAHHPTFMGRLYGVDLLGAALGCVLCVPLMVGIGVPGTVLLAGLLLVASGVRTGRTTWAALPAAALLLVGIAVPSLLPEPVPDRIKTMHPEWEHRRPILFSRWHPVFRVDVMESPFDTNARMLIHDGLWGSILNRWDGDRASLARFDTDPRALPFRLLGPGARVAVIGTAGGNEVLASLYFEASRVTGIELNPVSNALLQSRFAEYTGRLAERPGVELVNAEGRSYLRQHPREYDLLWLVAPDSYAAMNAATSGAFVLSESYLYTTGMIADGLARLAPDGILCTQFGEVSFAEKPNRTLRYLRTARAAFAAAGIDEFRNHVLVATSPGFGPRYSTILASKAPFSAEAVARFTAQVARISDGRVEYAPGAADPDPRLADVITLPEDALAGWEAAQPYALGPVTDDSPFFWHFVRFRDAIGRGAVDRFDLEDATGERLLMLLLALAAVFAAVLLLLPLAAQWREWREIPHKGRIGAYFAALGLGFLFLEIALIQRLTLFLGYPTYSLSVTLFSILVGSGLGSIACGAWSGETRRTLLVLLAVLATIVAAYLLGLTAILDRAGGAGFAARVAIAAALVAPVGFCLGWFMPLGIRHVATLSRHGERLVAWCWAVNGFFSVLSSVLATMVAMAVGFGAVMIAATVLYAIGVGALISVPSPRG